MFDFPQDINNNIKRFLFGWIPKINDVYIEINNINIIINDVLYFNKRSLIKIYAHIINKSDNYNIVINNDGLINEIKKNNVNKYVHYYYDDEYIIITLI